MFPPYPANILEYCKGNSQNKKPMFKYNDIKHTYYTVSCPKQGIIQVC